MIAASLAVCGKDRLRPRWRQLLGGASVSATLAALLVAGVGPSNATATAGSGPVTPTPGLSAGQTLSGGVFVGGGDATTAEAFGTWRGAPVQSITAYTGTDNWADVDNVTGKGLTRYWTGLGAHMIWSVPLIPSDGTSTLETAASGAYNANYAQVAAGLIAGGDASATIRLGWEFTGNWYAWSGINDPAAFAEAFRQAVVTMRNVSGANFTFDWSPALGQGNPSPMYPGDSYVDTIGADTFDRSWASAYPPTDHVDVWNALMTEPFGWNWLANFAETHGKRISLPEWGLSYMCSGHGGDDDAYFIQQMRQFINTHDVAFENYFDSDDTNCVRGTLNTGDFPAAAAEYQQLFSTPAVPSVAAPPAPPVSAPPTTVVPPTVVPKGPAGPPSGFSVRPGAPVMWISRSPHRSSPAVLVAQTLKQDAYIFYPITTDVRSVTFLIDGRKLRSVTRSPWDLVGTKASQARPLQPTNLSAGWHKIVADIIEDGGARENATGYVYVPPADAKPLWISAARLLRASASPAGGQTRTLNGGSVRSGQYLRLAAPPRTVRAQFILDGRIVRTLRSPAGAPVHVQSVSTTGLAKGKHRLEIRVRAKNGQLSDGAAVFIVK